MKIAIADIGSNTVKMTVFSKDGEILYKRSTPVGLVGYIKDGILSEEGISALAATLTSYQVLAEKEGAKTLYPFATAALRSAENSGEVIRRIKEACGCTIDLVSGEEEAALSLAGVSLSTKGLPPCDTLLDMGGGSCEVISKDGAAVSLPVGSLALFLKFVKNLLPTKDELAAIYRYTQTLACEAGIKGRNGEVYAVGGTLRAFALFHSLVYHRSFSESLPYAMTKEEMTHLLTLVCEMNNDTKLTLMRNIPERVHTFAVGLTAVLALLDLLGQERLTIVAGGAREGYFLKIKNQEKV